VKEKELMKREEQFEILKSLCAWDEESVGHFKIAFLAHYQLLNTIIDKCAERFKRIEIPRVDYFIYKEYVYLIYAQLCIVIECLCKALLEDRGYTEEAIIKLKHSLTKLIEEVGKNNQPREQSIYTILSKYAELINYLDSENMFVNARYMTYKDLVSLEHINMVEDHIDSIYCQYYKNFDIASIVYPDSM